MAKKKTGQGEPAAGVTPNAIVVRGSAEWRAWVKEAAEFKRTTMAGLIDIALADFMRQSGFRKVPPSRERPKGEGAR